MSDKVPFDEEFEINHVDEFELPRSVWFRGEGDYGSGLLLDDTAVKDEDVGKMCCLGVYLKACGLPEKYLNDVGEPVSVNSLMHHEMPSWLFKKSSVTYSSRMAASEDCSMLMSINDEELVDDETFEELTAEDDVRKWHHRSEEERERKIIELFAKNGIKVNIVD